MTVSHIPSACQPAPAGGRRKIERSDFVHEARAVVALGVPIGRFAVIANIGIVYGDLHPGSRGTRRSVHVVQRSSSGLDGIVPSIHEAPPQVIAPSTTSMDCPHRPGSVILTVQLPLMLSFRLAEQVPHFFANSEGGSPPRASGLKDCAAASIAASYVEITCPQSNLVG